MSALLYLIPISLTLGGLGILGFLWTLRANQYDDAKGNASRLLNGQFDDHPKAMEPSEEEIN